LGSTLVFGLPGNPVASFFGFELYVGPAVRRLAGETDFRTMWFEGIAAERFDINSDRSVFKVARVERDGLRWIVHPKASHGSADIFSVVGSNAFARFEKGQYSVSASEKISFFFHRGKQIGA
jgi:molybdopterin molybdotransferase